MDKLSELDQLIEQVLGVRPRGVEVVMEAGRSQTTALRSSDAIPAVPYPKLQITDQWGQNAGEGFDVQLFQTAGLGQGSDIKERLEKLNSLVDCESDCPTRVNEIIARLTIMDMWSSMMTDYVDSSKGFLFENFLALCLKGTVKGSTAIQDIEIMQSDESTLPPVSLKLLKDGSAIKGSLDNLYDLVMNRGETITYIVGYKKGAKLKDVKEAKEAKKKKVITEVEIWMMEIDRNFIMKQTVASKKTAQWESGPRTLEMIYQKAEGQSLQFYIPGGLLVNPAVATLIETIPIYSYQQMKNRAEKLTENLNRPVTEIYESLNLFSRELTEFYLSNDVRNGRKARDTFDRLVSAVNQEEKLK
jgi:hypothetical protein